MSKSVDRRLAIQKGDVKKGMTLREVLYQVSLPVDDPYWISQETAHAAIIEIFKGCVPEEGPAEWSGNECREDVLENIERLR